MHYQQCYRGGKKLMAIEDTTERSIFFDSLKKLSEDFICLAKSLAFS